MKRTIILIIFSIIYSFGFTQVIRDADVFTPFHDGLTAVKKNNQWAFFNQEGVKVIDFRNDIVVTMDDHFVDENGVYSVSYPLFKENRCLIRKLIDGYYHYGYIDKTGKVVIAPEYVNASNFVNGYAIIIKFVKNVIGENDVLNKRIVSYKLEEYIIDHTGKMVMYLDNARNSTPTKIKKNSRPGFESKFMAPHLIAVKTKNKTWDIYKF